MEILTYLFFSSFTLEPEDKLGKMAGFFMILGDDIRCRIIFFKLNPSFADVKNKGFDFFAGNLIINLWYKTLLKT